VEWDKLLVLRIGEGVFPTEAGPSDRLPGIQWDGSGTGGQLLLLLIPLWLLLRPVTTHNSSG